MRGYVACSGTNPTARRPRPPFSATTTARSIARSPGAWRESSRNSRVERGGLVGTGSFNRRGVNEPSLRCRRKRRTASRCAGWQLSNCVSQEYSITPKWRQGENLLSFSVLRRRVAKFPFEKLCEALGKAYRARGEPRSYTWLGEIVPQRGTPSLPLFGV